MRKRDQIESALTWTLTKPEVDDALGRMERLKSLINYALTNDLLYRPLQYVRDWKVNTGSMLPQAIHSEGVASRAQIEHITRHSERLQLHID
ncbi:hypothetical protein LTR46_011857, partial [Exophiala xenobiotica]